MLRFFTFAVCPFLKLYFFSSSSLGLPLSSMRLSSSRVVFLESKDCFVLSCLICVSGGRKKSAPERWNVRWGEEREEGKERWREKERERQTEGGGGGRRGLGLKRHTRAARNQSPVSIGRAPSLSSQSALSWLSTGNSPACSQRGRARADARRVQTFPPLNYSQS